MQHKHIQLEGMLLFTIHIAEVEGISLKEDECVCLCVRVRV